jgi:hypothetical protein
MIGKKTLLGISLISLCGSCYGMEHEMTSANASLVSPFSNPCVKEYQTVEDVEKDPNRPPINCVKEYRTLEDLEADWNYRTINMNVKMNVKIKVDFDSAEQLPERLKPEWTATCSDSGKVVEECMPLAPLWVSKTAKQLPYSVQPWYMVTLSCAGLRNLMMALKPDFIVQLNWAIPVDRQGRPILYDKDGRRILWDEQGRLILYDKYGRQILWNEQGRPILYDNVRPILYDKDGRQIPWDEQGRPIFYDKHGRQIPWDEQGQAIPWRSPTLLKIIEGK